MKVLIVEDEIMAQKSLSRALSQHCPDMEIVGYATSVKGAVAWLTNPENHADVIFMDVELSDGEGFEIFRQVEIKAKVIMTTAYDSYALKAFEAGSIDYLLKPVDVTALRRAVARCRVNQTNMDVEAILKAIKINNEVNDIITEIGNFRKLDNPPITGYEFSVITLVSMVCPKYLIVDKLRETLEELKTREPDDKPKFKIRVLLAGSENDDPDFIKLIEGCGALVVADRHCYGSLESRQHIDIKEGEDPLTAVARHYLLTSQCARFMEQQEMRHRKKQLADYAKEYKADGIIVESNKFCEYWSFERMIDTIVLPRDFGYPVCSIEKEYINTASGQLRTRFQAFVESLEIKKIQKGGKN